MIHLSHTTETETRSAAYSECEKYRYTLDIIWNANVTAMAVIGLNPSTATHLEDDPTLRRVKGFARDWGYGGVRMLNAFALRSTDPKALFKHPDPVGPENTIEFLKSVALDPTIAAWGGNIQVRRWRHWYRGHDIAAAILTLQCFQKTKDGHPSHPLYLDSTVLPQEFRYE